MSDRIAVMNQGRVLQVGTPAEVYDQPQSAVVAGFIGENNLLGGRLTSVIDGAVGVVELVSGARLRGRLNDGASTGSSVTLAFRPERIVAGKSEFSQAGADGDWNELTGRLTELQYVGTHWRAVITLPDGQLVVAHRQPAAQEGEPLALGESTTFRFWPRDAMLVTG